MGKTDSHRNMFLLDTRLFRDGDSSKLNAFVECWKRYYRGTVSLSPSDKRIIDYFAELNISGSLTEENVVRLLRWKDSRFLTHPKKGTNEANPKVAAVLEKLDALNRFRHGEIEANELEENIKNVFSYNVFELHRINLLCILIKNNII